MSPVPLSTSASMPLFQGAPVLVDPLVIVLLAVFIGIPLLSLVVMGVFALTAKFRFVEVRVRGGRLRGAVASALARVMVKDTDSIQIPLEVVLEKQGIMGGGTPLFGGAVVRDIECDVFMDGEHVSTVTEARSTRIDNMQRIVRLPVNVEVHLPQGVIRAYRDYRAKKRRAAEVELSVKGHVIIRHWWISRQVPVRVTKRVVIGEPVPRLVSVRWRALKGDTDVWEKAEARAVLVNPYQDETLEGRLRFELRRRRRLLPDVLLTVHEELHARLKPKRRMAYYFDSAFVDPGEEIPDPRTPEGGGGDPAIRELQTAGDRKTSRIRQVSREDEVPQALAGGEQEEGEEGKGVAVTLRVYWNDQELTPEEVRVLGVPGARHGPVLARDPEDGKDGKGLVARLVPSAHPPVRP